MRKPRTTRVVEMSSRMKEVFHHEDGDAQMERDRIFRENKFDIRYPQPWSDPEMQKWMFGYDAYLEGEKAWREFVDGYSVKGMVNGTK